MRSFLPVQYWCYTRRDAKKIAVLPMVVAVPGFADRYMLCPANMCRRDVYEGDYIANTGQCLANIPAQLIPPHSQ